MRESPKAHNGQKNLTEEWEVVRKMDRGSRHEYIDY